MSVNPSFRLDLSLKILLYTINYLTFNICYNLIDCAYWDLWIVALKNYKQLILNSELVSLVSWVATEIIKTQRTHILYCFGLESTRIVVYYKVDREGRKTKCIVCYACLSHLYYVPARVIGRWILSERERKECMEIRRIETKYLVNYINGYKSSLCMNWLNRKKRKRKWQKITFLKRVVNYNNQIL